jgi:hypothetical protein
MSTILSCPYSDAYIDSFYFTEIFLFYFILYKPLCNAVQSLSDFIFTSIPAFISNAIILSYPHLDAKIEYLFLIF